MAQAAMTGASDEEVVWQSIASMFNLTSDELSEMQTDFWSDNEVDEQMLSFLEKANKLHKTAILTNAWQGLRSTIAEKLGLGNLVDVIVISAEEGLAKPDPRIYQLTVARMSVSCEEVIFVDDRWENVQGAQAAGLEAMLFRTAEQTIRELERYREGRRKYS